MGLARGLEHEFLGHIILNYFDVSVLDNAREASEVEIYLVNKIRQEIEIPGRLNSDIAEVILENGNLTKVFQTWYGFIDGSDEIDPDIYIWPGAPSPIPDFPLIEGFSRIYKGSALKINNVNYTITIRYKYNEKVFDFI